MDLTKAVLTKMSMGVLMEAGWIMGSLIGHK
jgi:hypothetical protein